MTDVRERRCVRQMVGVRLRSTTTRNEKVSLRGSIVLVPYRVTLLSNLAPGTWWTTPDMVHKGKRSTKIGKA